MNMLLLGGIREILHSYAMIHLARVLNEIMKWRALSCEGGAFYFRRMEKSFADVV
mgnify:CR=1 FL=1